MGTKSSPRTCPWTPALFLAVFLMIQAAVSSQRAEKELGDTCSQYECVAYGQICSADYKCICLLGWYQYPNTKQCTVSDPVQSLTATDVTSSDISVSWLPPPTSGTGEVIGYVLRVYNSDDLCLKRRYFLCAGCTQKPELRTNCPSSSETASSLTQEDLNNPAKIISGAMYNIPPYRNLTLTVSAIKNNAEGIEARLPFVTKIGTPRQYTSLEVDPIRDLDANQVHINVSWTPGVYTGPYFTHLDILKKELPSGVFRQEKVIILNEDNRTYLKTNLQAGWDYRVTVMAVIPRQNAENLTGPQFRPWVDVRMPSLPPGQVQLVSVRGDNYNADEMTLSFRCPPEMERNGTLRGFVVRVMVLSVQDNTTPQLQGEFFIPLGKHHREPCSYKVDAADL
ncbi:uncharacterized protein LOC101862081, partial [Aplysia californica]|uniref:Uncharacterized protein LOC101862081 n=1 Tax=Aplysia californica TaxID=6500 RepID=A0ABM1W3B9_APLCA